MGLGVVTSAVALRYTMAARSEMDAHRFSTVKMDVAQLDGDVVSLLKPHVILCLTPKCWA